MKKKNYRRRLSLITLSVLTGLATVGTIAWQYLKTQNIPILQPKGDIAATQLNLLIFTGILCLVVIIPVFTIAIFIAFKYHEDNEDAKYTPDWDNNTTIEVIWWGIPIFLILIVATVTWISTHAIDPYKPLDKTKPTMTVQVVALNWKWLFIYPDQNIATVNYVTFPVDTQMDFALTADAPMNSFWIPQLAGQMYTMPGMTTHQHLNATEIGTYAGSSANISGEGFAGMKFKAKAVSSQNFTKWVNSVKADNNKVLDMTTYEELAKESKYNPEATYGTVNGDIFNHVLGKYMNHDTQPQSDTSKHTNMNMDHMNMPMEMK